MTPLERFAADLSLRTEIQLLLIDIETEITRSERSGITGRMYDLLIQRRNRLKEQLRDVQDDIDHYRAYLEAQYA